LTPVLQKVGVFFYFEVMESTVQSSVNQGKAKWVNLMIFALMAALSQVMWLNFAAMLGYLQSVYSVTEEVASLVILVFPLGYVLFGFHAGRWIDRVGYKKVLVWAGLGMTLAALGRLLPLGFAGLLVCQIGLAIVQPYIINAINALVADGFAPEEQAGAVGLGTAAMFIGMALGIGLTPVLVESLGFAYGMGIWALASALATLACMLGLKETRSVHASGSSLAGVKALMKRPEMWRLLLVSLLALGYFNGLTTFIELILGEKSISAEESGLIAAVMILGGIVGAVVVPLISDKLGKRKPFILLAAFSALVLTYPLLQGGGLVGLMGLGASLGFLFLPGYALLLSHAERVAGVSLAGTATGLLMISGNVGAVLVILGMQTLHGISGTWQTAVWGCMGILVLALCIAFFLRDNPNNKDCA
jgi:predicted MFS family arabinose efflux permease